MERNGNLKVPPIELEDALSSCLMERNLIQKSNLGFDMEHVKIYCLFFAVFCLKWFFISLISESSQNVDWNRKKTYKNSNLIAPKVIRCYLDQLVLKSSDVTKSNLLADNRRHYYVCLLSSYCILLCCRNISYRQATPLPIDIK